MNMTARHSGFRHGAADAHKRTTPPAQLQAIMQAEPFTRLLLWLASFAVILPFLIAPTSTALTAMAATLGLVLTYTLAAYVSSFIAGIKTILYFASQYGE